MKKLIITHEQKYKIYEMYFIQKIPSSKIAEYFNCSNTTIQKQLKRDGYTLRNAFEANKRFHINEDYFDIIDTEEKAYWLGFLYADGCNNEKYNKVRLSLAEQDKEIVERFSYTIFGEDRVKHYKRPQRKNGQDLFYITICNHHISKQLAKLGCVQNKTFKLLFPEWLNVKLYNHFVRGYFDGDGCLSLYSGIRKSRAKNPDPLKVFTQQKAGIYIVSTLEFLTFVSKYIKQQFDVNSYFSKRHKNRDNNNFTIAITGNNQVKKVLDWLYKDATIYLERKYKKYIELKEANETVSKYSTR